MNRLQHGHAPIESPESELSWEEKFRWETARKVLLDFINHGYATVESFSEIVTISVKNTDLLIAELNRGKE